MGEHTPGPLTTRGPSNGLGPLDDGGDYGIMDAAGKVVGEAYYKVGVAMFRPAEANARLWAAAPDLLAACDNPVRVGHKVFHDPQWQMEFAANILGGYGDVGLAEFLREKARMERAAIAKAKGETNANS